MVDLLGRWTPENDYSTFPKEKWCDMDRVASLVMERNYTPKTDMENLVTMVILHFEGETDGNSLDFLPVYNDDLDINIEGLSGFVEASGGFETFDYRV